MTGAPPVALGQGLRIQLHVSAAAAGSRPRLDVDLHLPGRGVTAIFGPSGAGKSTLLRAIAGLVPAQGTVVVGGRAWQTPQWQLPAHRRPIGYVFQQAALFPHLRVSGNLRYAAKRAGPEAPDWTDVVEQLELADLLERRPQTLSGGERQRVAIARALLIGPELLLMDEPLSALDADRREQLLPYLDRLRRELAIPILYVTHRRYEVGRLADDVVALNDGRAAGPEPVAAWLPAVSAGAEVPAVLIEAQIVEQDRSWGLARAVFDGGMFWVDGRHGRVGDRLRLQIQARDVSLSRDAQVRSSLLNRLPVTLESIGAGTGAADQLVCLRAGSARFLAQVTRRSVAELSLRPGDRLWAQIKAVAVLR